MGHLRAIFEAGDVPRQNCVLAPAGGELRVVPDDP
jgi:hypothetical protein